MIVTILFCVVGDGERENTGALRVRDCSLSSLIPLEGVRVFGQNRKIANVNLISSKGIKLGLWITELGSIFGSKNTYTGLMLGSLLWF